MAIHHKLIALGFPAEDGMIVQHQAGTIPAALPNEKQRCRQPADATTDNNAIKHFTGINNVRR